MPEFFTKPGLLLVGHGTRSERGTASAQKLAELVAARLNQASVELAFLELQEPTIAGGLNRLIERGAREIVVLPLLLFSAGHDKRDIPAAIRAWEGTGKTKVVVADPLGCDPAIVDLSARRFTEALQGRPPVAPAETTLLLVGRGSRDAGATTEMHEFGRLLGKRIEVGDITVAFLAMAQPSAGQVLTQLAAQEPAPKRVIIQPHLLFHGDLVESLHAQVRAIAAAQPQTEWLLAPLLADDLGTAGPADDLLVRVVADRYRQVAIRIVAEPAQD